MDTTLIVTLRAAAGLVLGGSIGLGFGLIQQAARRRHERRQAGGDLKTPWALMPGSMRRVAVLLAVLAGIQVLGPAMFVDGTQWWISGGVVAGYAASLLSQLRLLRGPGRTSTSH
jgi:hypothetical protein